MEKNVNAQSKELDIAQNFPKQVGPWSKLQNLKYAAFLEKNQTLYSRKKKSQFRKQTFFIQMSKFLLTRTSTQCRCHHQKVFLKFKSLQKIVGHYKRCFQVKNLEAYLNLMPQIAQQKPKKTHVQRIQSKQEQKNEIGAFSENVNSQLQLTNIPLISFFNYNYWNQKGYTVYSLQENLNLFTWMTYGNYFPLMEMIWTWQN